MNDKRTSINQQELARLRKVEQEANRLVASLDRMHGREILSLSVRESRDALRGLINK